MHVLRITEISNEESNCLHQELTREEKLSPNFAEER